MEDTRCGGHLRTVRTAAHGVGYDGNDAKKFTMVKGNQMYCD